MAAGINPVDTYIRSGAYEKTNLPYTPGRDGAGVVKKVGCKVTRFKVRFLTCIQMSIKPLSYYFSVRIEKKS